MSNTLILSADAGNGIMKWSASILGYPETTMESVLHPTVYAEWDASNNLSSSSVDVVDVPYVTRNGKSYTFGLFAEMTGLPTRYIINDSRYDSELLDTIFPQWVVAVTAFEYFRDEFNYDEDNIVYGALLPPYVFSATDAETNNSFPVVFGKRIAKALKQGFLYCGKKVKFNLKDDAMIGGKVRDAIFILPEAVAGVYYTLYDDAGRLTPFADAKGTKLIIDIGTFTVDFAEVQNNKWRPEGLFVSEVNQGMMQNVIKPLRARLDSDRALGLSGKLTYIQVEEACRTGSVTFGKEQIDVSDHVRAQADQFWVNLQEMISFHFSRGLNQYVQVIPVGGGSDFLRKWASNPLAKRYGSLVIGFTNSDSWGVYANTLGALRYMTNKLKQNP